MVGTSQGWDQRTRIRRPAAERINWRILQILAMREPLKDVRSLNVQKACEIQQSRRTAYPPKLLQLIEKLFKLKVYFQNIDFIHSGRICLDFFFE